MKYSIWLCSGAWGICCGSVSLGSSLLLHSSSIFSLFDTCLLHVLFDFSGSFVLYDYFLPYASVYPYLVILFGGRFGSGHAFVYKDMVPLLWVKCHLWFIKGLGHFSNLCLITCFISAPCQSRPMMLVVPILYLSSRCSDFVKGSDLFPCSCRAQGKDLFRYYLQFSEKVGEEGKH